MLLKSNNRPVDYSDKAEPTSKYKIRKANERLRLLQELGALELRRPNVGEAVSRGLSKEQLQAKYDPAKETGIRYLMGVYRVPIGASAQQIANLDKEKVLKWIDTMSKMGWDWVRGSNIETGNGVYPAKDLGSNVPDLGHRERIVRTKFRKRDIEIVKTELKPEVIKNLVLGEKGNVVPELS